MRSVICLAFLLLAAGCRHDGSFDQQGFTTDTPFNPGPPTVLTANQGADSYPFVLPDNSAFLYSFSSWYERGDTCLGSIPVGQARVTRELCPGTDTTSGDSFLRSAVSGAGRVAFLLLRVRSFSAGPYYSAIIAAPLADIRDSSDIVPVPLRTPDGVLHPIDSLARIGWIRGDTLAFLATGRIYLVDTRDPERVITWLDAPGPVADFDVDGDRLFISLRGSTTLFQYDLATRQALPAHDFGPAGPIGLIQVAGPRAVALATGGLYLADLTTHSQTAINTYGQEIQQIALPRGASALIAEARTGFSSDLMAFQLP